jgi:hypothetical protein
VLDDGDERDERVGDADDGSPVGRQVFRDDDGGGAAGRQMPGLLVVLDEGDVAGTGLGEGAGVADQCVALARQVALDQFRQLADGGSHSAPSLP